MCYVKLGTSYGRKKFKPRPHDRILVSLRGSFQNVLISTPVFIWKFSIICQVVAYGRLKTKENFKSLASKSGSGCLWEVAWYIIFLKTGHWGEVVAYERWSKPEVRLYYQFILPSTSNSLGTPSSFSATWNEYSRFWSGVALFNFEKSTRSGLSLGRKYQLIITTNILAIFPTIQPDVYWMW